MYDVSTVHVYDFFFKSRGADIRRGSDIVIPPAQLSNHISYPEGVTPTVVITFAAL